MFSRPLQGLCPSGAIMFTEKTFTCHWAMFSRPFQGLCPSGAIMFTEKPFTYPRRSSFNPFRGSAHSRRIIHDHTSVEMFQVLFFIINQKKGSFRLPQSISSSEHHRMDSSIFFQPSVPRSFRRSAFLPLASITLTVSPSTTTPTR